MPKCDFKHYKLRCSQNVQQADIVERLIEMSGEHFDDGLWGIYGTNIDWDSYQLDMTQLSKEYPETTFSLIVSEHYDWRMYSVVFKNGKTCKPRPAKTIKFGDTDFSEDLLIEQEFKEKYVNDQRIDFDAIIKGLRKSHESSDMLVALLLEEYKSQIKNIDADYFHKCFRQCDVLNSGRMDMVMWHALHLSELFWKLLRKQYPSA